MNCKYSYCNNKINNNTNLYKHHVGFCCYKCKTKNRYLRNKQTVVNKPKILKTSQQKIQKQKKKINLTFILPTDDFGCAYCGSPAVRDRDHVVPSSFAQVNKHFSCLTVDSCQMCNNLLSDSLCLTIETRAGYLYEKYLKKYKNTINMPNWTKEELDEMSYELRSSIEAGLRLKQECSARIAHCMKVAKLPLHLRRL